MATDAGRSSEHPVRAWADPFARWAVRLRILFLLGWIIAAAVAVLTLPPLKSSGGGGLRGLVPPDSPAIAAEIDSVERFGFPLLSRTVVVQRDPEGLSPLAQARVLLRSVAITQGRYPGLRQIAGALPLMNTLSLFPSSSEAGTTAITYLFYLPEVGIGTRERFGQFFVDRLLDPELDHPVGITGAVPGRLAQARAISDGLPLVEGLTVAAIATIVGLYFRSLGAPLVTLAAAAIAFLLSTRAVAWLLGSIGIGLPQELEPLMVVLLLGIVTDYSIFFLEHARERLREGGPRLRAAEVATSEVIGIVVAAGVAVTLGTAALLAARLETFRALGPGMAVTVFVGLIVSVTFVPAAVAVFGRLVFWPSAQTPRALAADVERPGHAVRHRLILAATRRPIAIVIAIVGVVALGAASAGLGSALLGFGIVDALPDDSRPKVAAVEAGKGFAPGIISPTLLQLTSKTDVPLDPQQLIELQAAIETHPGVAGVFGPREAQALATSVERLPAGGGETARDLSQQVEAAMLTTDGIAARMLIVLDDPPLGGPAIDTFRDLRADLGDLLRATGFDRTSAALAGDTALAAETIDRTLGDLQRIAITVTALMIVLLAIYLRSLVAPALLVAVSLLAFLSTLGITALVFVGLFDVRSMSFFVPFASAVLLIALGSDYNIFLVGRIWDEASRRPLREAIASATVSASRPISVAGVTLATSFAVLAVIPIRPMQQFAFAMTAGIILDTFFVRSIVVPAVVAGLGPAGAWPGRFRVRGHIGEPV